MFRSFLLLVLSLSLQFISTSSESQKCHLLKVRKEIDVEKLSKTSWYTGLQTADVVASMLSCTRFSNFTYTNSGFRVVVTEHGSRYVQFGLHFNRDENGIYHLSKSDRGINHAEHISEMDEHDNEAVLDMDQLLAGGNFVFVTDYENYFASFLCPPGGISDHEHRMIRGFFPSPNSILSQVAAFINVLHGVGISAKFYPSTCSETNWSQELPIE
uniref:uncharacterized protein LOC120348113 n=1 Tax=Styela clava TaxID=7725 RepID=UPI00193AD7DC|nr:uncharacterized protein LOC120348113 [Styela clava]